LALQAVSEHNIDLNDSNLVGDKLSDIQSGKAAGGGSCFFLRTGKLVLGEDSMQADGTFDDLLVAADFIV